MKKPRITIGLLMGAVVIFSMFLALVASEMRGGRNLTTGYAGTDMALFPTMTAFGIATFSMIRQRWKCSPFLWGFVTVGWVSVLVYLAICFRYSWIVEIPIQYYWNDIDYGWFIWFTDLADDYAGNVANLLVIGLILAMPELMMATLGGLIARWIWGKR
jgi:hypothetical protein